MRAIELRALVQLQRAGYAPQQLGTLEDLDLRLQVRFDGGFIRWKRGSAHIQRVLIGSLQFQQRGGLVDRFLVVTNQQRRHDAA